MINYEIIFFEIIEVKSNIYFVVESSFFFLKVLEKCHLSWRRATADEYEQCTIIGAFRQIIHRENDGKYLMSLVTINSSDRTLFTNNSNIAHQFLTRINPHGQFIHIDQKFVVDFCENIFIDI